MNAFNLAIIARIEAKPEKTTEVENLLKNALTLAKQENHTTSWFALKIGKNSYGIFDTFENKEGRERHLNGKIAQALLGKVEELLSCPPEIIKAEVIAAKPI